ncbi:hypothetical protein Aduo_011879 [Ancylostoma duodenale]
MGGDSSRRLRGSAGRALAARAPSLKLRHLPADRPGEFTLEGHGKALFRAVAAGLKGAGAALFRALNQPLLAMREELTNCLDNADAVRVCSRRRMKFRTRHKWITENGQKRSSRSITRVERVVDCDYDNV